jgi:hypothetical protein
MNAEKIGSFLDRVRQPLCSAKEIASVSGSQREFAHSTIRTRATVEDVRQPHMEQEMAPRLHSFQDKPDAVNTDAFLLILLLILQRVFPAKRSKAEQHQNRDSTYENQPWRHIAKTSKTARSRL